MTNHSYAYDVDDTEPREQDVRRLKPHEVLHQWSIVRVGRAAAHEGRDR